MGFLIRKQGADGGSSTAKLLKTVEKILIQPAAARPRQFRLRMHQEA